MATRLWWTMRPAAVPDQRQPSRQAVPHSPGVPMLLGRGRAANTTSSLIPDSSVRRAARRWGRCWRWAASSGSTSNGSGKQHQQSFMHIGSSVHDYVDLSMREEAMARGRGRSRKATMGTGRGRGGASPAMAPRGGKVRGLPRGSARGGGRGTGRARERAHSPSPTPSSRLPLFP